MSTSTENYSPKTVIDFWKQAGPAKWFAKDDAFDVLFRDTFLDWHMAAARRELDHWMADAQGCLALLILLDQFPRNAFRGTAHMFATDSLACMIARHSIDRGDLEHIEPELRSFLILPFEHAEDLALQNEAVRLCEALGSETLKWAKIHRDIIADFGRFPHRNASLGRETTEAEAAFLKAGGFSG